MPSDIIFVRLTGGINATYCLDKVTMDRQGLAWPLPLYCYQRVEDGAFYMSDQREELTGTMRYRKERESGLSEDDIRASHVARGVEYAIDE